ncbi:POU class 2 homeobox associating-factor 2 [Dunckerocampus dactyliophorus]|uniref:POU class 2 homeobox associating-factor 2 n=1 Tax=Dunckerocampus dactyliophorus TaxID=161453 RepID=UPI002404CA0C|nr:POU class 2 homeobox associating-factor 2 [Dunckerocampus dactyliophorus]
MDTEYSKRVYQGVRVKHTVKDLLAEKRSRQTNGPRYSGDSTSPPSLVQLSGSHMLPSYYGMRRPFLSDPDLGPSTKQFSADVYPATFGGRPLGYDSSTFSSLIDTYYPETFSDYRSSATFSTSGGSFLPSSLLPPFSGESSHLYGRDSWEQSVPETVPQVEALCPDNLASVSVPEVQPSQGSSAGSGSYTLHSLEDNHYHLLASSNSSSFLCPPYMNSEMVSKIAVEDTASSLSSLPPGVDAHTSWEKEEEGSSWSSYELRRAY